jgi:hypothetical protein
MPVGIAKGYCEGYCEVFPAKERRSNFTEADIHNLANLCHNCEKADSRIHPNGGRGLSNGRLPPVAVPHKTGKNRHFRLAEIDLFQSSVGVQRVVRFLKKNRTSRCATGTMVGRATAALVRFTDDGH